MPTTVDPNTVKRVEIAYRPYALQHAIHQSKSRIRVVCWGRRSGKSIMAIVEGFCMNYDLISQGKQRPRGVIVAPTNKMLRENWIAANTVLKQAIVQPYISEQRLDLGGLGTIDMVSTESQGGAGRGAGYDWAVVDEASRVPKVAWEADLRPSLAETRGRALIISTPFGLNWFYDIYRLGEDGDPDISVYHASTLDCWRSRFSNNPDRLKLMEDEWLMLQRTTSESKFREEFLAEFLQSEGQHFTLKPELWRGNLRPAVPGRHYLAGVDVARKEDWMVTTILEYESQQLVAVMRSRHQDWAMQKAASLALIGQYPNCLTYIDSTGVGDPIAQDYRRAGLEVIDVLFTPNRKSELVENLTLAIDQCYLGIPDEHDTKWLKDELQQYQAVKQPSGAIRYGAPEGKHDDGVTSLMLAAWGLSGQWRHPEEADVTQPANWWERSNPWEWLEYEKKVASYRDRFPNDPVPLHPTDLAWSRMN